MKDNCKLSVLLIFNFTSLVRLQILGMQMRSLNGVFNLLKMITGQITVVIFHEIATVSRFQTKSQTVWILSWKSVIKSKIFISVLSFFQENHSKGNKTKRKTHSLQNFHKNVWRSCSLPIFLKLIQSYWEKSVLSPPLWVTGQQNPEPRTPPPPPPSPTFKIVPQSLRQVERYLFTKTPFWSGMINV